MHTHSHRVGATTHYDKCAQLLALLPCALQVTPYAKAATEAFDMVFSGGKKDDITILVAYID